jgi:hypothetical protein
MLALEHSRRQHPFSYAFGAESTLHDPYLGQSMNGTYASFDSTAAFVSMPFSFYESSSLSAEAPRDSTQFSMFASSQSNSDFPPSASSNTSAASIPSNTPSTVGSPYSNHAQAVSSQKSWSAGNQGLGLAPTILNSESFDQSFGSIDVDPDLTFSIHSKTAEDFVGECANPSPSSNRAPKPISFGQPPCSQSSSLSTCARASSGDCVTIDSVLEGGKSAICTPSHFRSPQASRSFTASPSASKENLLANSQSPQAVFKSHSHPASLVSKASIPSPILLPPSFGSATSVLADARPKGAQPISMSDSDPASETPTPTYESQLHSQFFAQSSGSFMPPLESSCSFSLQPSFHSRSVAVKLYVSLSYSSKPLQ